MEEESNETITVTFSFTAPRDIAQEMEDQIRDFVEDMWDDEVQMEKIERN